MFATVKKVSLKDREIECYDLTYGYLIGIENGSIEDNAITAIVDGSNLNEDDVLALRKHEIEMLYRTILQLTYPAAYNEDGTLKEIDTKQEDDKKSLAYLGAEADKKRTHQYSTVQDGVCGNISGRAK